MSYPLSRKSVRQKKLQMGERKALVIRMRAHSILAHQIGKNGVVRKKKIETQKCREMARKNQKFGHVGGIGAAPEREHSHAHQQDLAGCLTVRGWAHSPHLEQADAAVAAAAVAATPVASAAIAAAAVAAAAIAAAGTAAAAIAAAAVASAAVAAAPTVHASAAVATAAVIAAAVAAVNAVPVAASAVTAASAAVGDALVVAASAVAAAAGAGGAVRAVPYAAALRAAALGPVVEVPRHLGARTFSPLLPRNPLIHLSGNRLPPEFANCNRGIATVFLLFDRRSQRSTARRD